MVFGVTKVSTCLVPDFISLSLLGLLFIALVEIINSNHRTFCTLDATSPGDSKLPMPGPKSLVGVDDSKVGAALAL